MLRQTNVFDAETGQIEFQDHLIAGFVHIHRRMVLAFAKDITKLKGIQKITDLAEMPAEEFLPERLPAGKVWHITTLRPLLDNTNVQSKFLVRCGATDAANNVLV
jgi:hypothetical protein